MVLLLVVTTPAVAGADWLITPFLGNTFLGNTNLITLSQTTGDKKFTFGGSVALLTDGLFGIEADFGHTPRFFERDAAGLGLQSTVMTLTGNVLLAVPTAVTRESLRPYLVGGVGLLRASNSDVGDVFTFDGNLLALNIGGGVIGMVSQRAGVRFDVRQFRNLKPDDSAVTTSGSLRLSFWRASVGVVLRY